MKIDSFLISEAIAYRDWIAASSLLIDHFDLKDIARKFRDDIDVVERCLVPSISYWDGELMYGWTKEHGFSERTETSHYFASGFYYIAYC